MEKRNFLLTHSHDVITLPQEAWEYDEAMQINIINNTDGDIIPVCSKSSMVTRSKTEAAPGDDDPDRDAELCY